MLENVTVLVQCGGLLLAAVAFSIVIIVLALCFSGESRRADLLEALRILSPRRQSQVLRRPRQQQNRSNANR